MRPLFFGLVLTAALAATGGVAAAKIGLEATTPPPADLKAGDAWNTSFAVMRDPSLDRELGPLARVTPTVTIRHRETGRALTYRGAPVGKDGASPMRIVFPTAGTWDVEAGDGIAGHPAQTFDPITVSAAARTAGPTNRPPEGGAALPLLLAALVALAGGAALVLARRRRKAAVSRVDEPSTGGERA